MSKRSKYPIVEVSGSKSRTRSSRAALLVIGLGHNSDLGTGLDMQ